ncbi:hypothetical protein E2562_031296 [Oryza meyeriana var. granulata]|uniref:Uncharacterized protein n=1 Tax=Oryza meyeriana var. granulata TaxID=110450 RepID=A0A6G1C9Z2_9ORYZ|nr:hypothetical protein E2562_031296 [Oryza meyeriana var. granulata]
MVTSSTTTAGTGSSTPVPVVGSASAPPETVLDSTPASPRTIARIGVDSEGDLLDPSRYCTTYYLHHGSRDYSYVRLFTDIDHLWPCGALFNQPGHHGGTHRALLRGDLGHLGHL